MVLRLSHAPKFGAALAFGLIATGIAVSESQVWDSPAPALSPPAAEQVGPPMPETLNAPERTAVPVNLAEAERATSDANPQAGSGEPPEIALYLLNRTFAPDAELDPVRTAGTRNVRTIELPRRGDELDELGRPADEPDEYELAALPSPETSPEMEFSSPAIDENLVAPIPAPAYRRPLASYLGAGDPVEQPREPRNLGPIYTGGLPTYYAQDVQGTWPRRLDEVVSVEGRTRTVPPISTDNIFMSDWVESPRGGARNVVGW